MNQGNKFPVLNNPTLEKEQDIDTISVFPELNDAIKNEYSLFKFGYKKALDKFSRAFISHLSLYEKDEILILAPSLKESSAIKFLVQKLSSHFPVITMKGSSANKIATPYSSLCEDDRFDKRNSTEYHLEGDFNNTEAIKKVILLDDSVVTGKTLDVLKQVFENSIEISGDFDYEKLCLISIDADNASAEHQINRFYIENNYEKFLQLYKNNPEDFNYTNYLIRFLKTEEGMRTTQYNAIEFQREVNQILNTFL